MVAAPSMVAAPTMVETMVAPAAPGFAVPAPVRLTEGLLEPAKVEAERAAYSKALEAQLAKQSGAVLEEAKIQKAMIDQTAKTQLAQYQLQVEEEFKMQCLAIDRGAQTQLT